MRGLGLVSVPTSAGVITVPSSGQEAQGFITQAAADEARRRFTDATGVAIPTVPTSPSEVGPWAKQQAQIYASSAMRAGIEQGKRAFEDKMRLAADTFRPLTEDETAAWAIADLERNGPPTSPEQAAQMARRYVAASCGQIGLPPEFISAANLVLAFPDTVDGALSWGVSLATQYLSQYGVPIVSRADVSSFMSACARTAIAQLAPGIPFSMLELSWGALKDGSISGDEVKGLVIGAAAWAGAAIGQMFGIPAPLGALLANIIVGEIVSVLSGWFGWGPSASSLLQAAQAAAARAARAESARCTDQATVLWLAYQHYWERIETNLEAAIRANQEWLTPSGYCSRSDGIRLFDATSLDVVHDEQGNPVVLRRSKGEIIYQTYPVQVARQCTEALGCPYLASAIDDIVVRDEYAFTPDALQRVPLVTRSPPGCDALTALAYWGARRYATPFQVWLVMLSAEEPDPKRRMNPASDPYAWTHKQPKAIYSEDGPQWMDAVHSDREYLADWIGKVTTSGDRAGTVLTQCITPAWASFMFDSLTQAASATGLVSRDISRTVSTATSYYGIKYHMDSLAGMEWSVASAAQQRAAQRAAAATVAAFRYALIEARRKGVRQADLVSYGLLAAGTGAMAGWAASSLMGRRR